MLNFVFAGTNSEEAEIYSKVLTLTLAHERPGVNAAPSPVWFECTNIAGVAAAELGSGEVYDPKFHEVLYLWDFADTANATPTAMLNMPNRWKDTNKAYGRRVAHCYNDKGTYLVTCYAYEPATRRFGSEVMEVVVDDPEEVFANTRTIIYDPNSNANTSRYPNATIVTTWAAVQAARNALGVANYGRVLMAPGASYTLNKSAQRIDAAGWSNMRIEALEPENENRPAFYSIGRQGAQTNSVLFRDTFELCEEMLFHGIDFYGEWDAATETGRVVLPFFIDKSNGYTPQRSLFCLHRCKVSGFKAVAAHRALASGNKWAYAMHSDTQVTNWQDYGILGGLPRDQRSSTAIIGTSVAQHPNALSGGPKNGLYNNHGAIRDFGSADLFISVADTFTCNGWSTGGTFEQRSIPADQAAIRINTTGDPGTTSYLDRVAVEGHIWMQEQDVTSIDIPGNHIFDKVLQVGGSRNNLGYLVSALFGGLTARNYLGIKLNLPEATDANSLRTRSFWSYNDRDGSPANGPAGVRLYNATCIDLRTDANARNETIVLYEEGSKPFTVGIYENNLLHQPNRSGSVSVSGKTINLGAVTEGFVPRHQGPRFNFLHEEAPLPNAVSGSGGTFAIPYDQITNQLLKMNGPETGTPTNQAYWQAIASIDMLHRILVNGVAYHADQGEISVALTASNVTITNNSGTNWPAGEIYRLRLDRKSLIPPIQSQFDSTTQSLEIVVQATDPRTGETADMGITAYDDFFGAERPATNNTKGALL